MAGENLSGYIVLNEIANFKGTPKKFTDFENRLKSRFPELGTKGLTKKLTDAMVKSGLDKNHFGFSNLFGGDTEVFDY